jgi:tetratricopeptide (TPR) repeat protein
MALGFIEGPQRVAAMHNRRQESWEMGMFRSSYIVAAAVAYITAAVLATAYMVAAVLVTVGVSMPASAGMSQDLANCTAAQGRSSAAACTRVMDSGRLPREQFYIGYFNRGSGYRSAGDFDKALADFNKVVELKPRFARGYHMRGVVQDDLGARDKALADLDRAIELNSRDWSAYFSRATVLRANNDPDAALVDLATAADLKPKESKVILLRALINSDKGDYAAARADINKVISAGHERAAAYYARAAVAYQEGRLDAATADLDRVFALSESFPAAHMLMGRILEARGDTAGARARYRKAAGLAPGSFDARSARRTARDRLQAMGDTVGGTDNADVALVQPAKDVGCKRFLPATGTIISASCDDK